MTLLSRCSAIHVLYDYIILSPVPLKTTIVLHKIILSILKDKSFVTLLTFSFLTPEIERIQIFICSVISYPVVHMLIEEFII